MKQAGVSEIPLHLDSVPQNGEGAAEKKRQDGEQRREETTVCWALLLLPTPLMDQDLDPNEWIVGITVWEKCNCLIVTFSKSRTGSSGAHSGLGWG